MKITCLVYRRVLQTKRRDQKFPFVQNQEASGNAGSVYARTAAESFPDTKMQQGVSWVCIKAEIFSGNCIPAI